jgi:hypothetical protein
MGGTTATAFIPMHICPPQCTGIKFYTSSPAPIHATKQMDSELVFLWYGCACRACSIARDCCARTGASLEHVEHDAQQALRRHLLLCRLAMGLPPHADLRRPPRGTGGCPGAHSAAASRHTGTAQRRGHPAPWTTRSQTGTLARLAGCHSAKLQRRMAQSLLTIVLCTLHLGARWLLCPMISADTTAASAVYSSAPAALRPACNV